MGDPSNRIMGAPYQPTHNWDNVGGFGIYCVDGNQPPCTLSTCPPQRNSFTVDYSSTPPTFALNSVFAATWVPMSDMYPNLFNPGTFVGVGYYTSDPMVGEYPLLPAAAPPPKFIIPKPLAWLTQPSNYDATWLEDGNLWVFSLDAASNQPFFQVVDIRTGRVTSVAVPGLPAGPWGAVWHAPWEKPGMVGYICSDVNDTVYAVDFATSPVKITSIYGLVSTTNLFVNGAREAEEAQLTSWWVDPGRGSRQFLVDFSRSYVPGSQAVLLPSLSGLAPVPVLIGGLEVYLALDPALIALALGGALPYKPFVSLNTSGQGIATWTGFGAPLGLPVYWQAFLLSSTGTLLDVSNLISVRL